MTNHLVPVQILFGQLVHLTETLSLELGKKVLTERIGDSVLVDSTVLPPLSEAFLHLVRNCVDHAAESMEERLRQGKNPFMELVFSAARNAGGELELEIRDDGRGLDPEKIKASLIKKKLRTARELALLSEPELLQMVFLPGFSTREIATEVSGRGIGMDVVKDRIETALGGKIRLESKVGAGTTIRVTLP